MFPRQRKPFLPLSLSLSLSLSLVKRDCYRIGKEIVITSIIAIINFRRSIRHQGMSGKSSLLSSIRSTCCHCVYMSERERERGGGGKGKRVWERERECESDNGRYQKRSDEITHGIGSWPSAWWHAWITHTHAHVCHRGHPMEKMLPLSIFLGEGARRDIFDVQTHGVCRSSTGA